MNENPETQNRVPVAGLAVDACSARGESQTPRTDREDKVIRHYCDISWQERYDLMCEHAEALEKELPKFGDDSAQHESDEDAFNGWNRDIDGYEPTLWDAYLFGLKRRNARLESERDQLRAVFPKILEALGNGACCTPDVSVEFIKAIPNEVAEVVAQLRAEVNAQCLLNAKGSEREAVLLGRVDRMAKECLNLRADLDAIKAIRNEETARAERAEEIADRYGKRAISLEAELAACKESLHLAEGTANLALVHRDAAEAQLHALRLVCGTTDANKFSTWVDRANAKAEKAEAELANIRALANRRNKRDHAQDTTHQLVAALDQALDIAQAELAATKSTLDEEVNCAEKAEHEVVRQYARAERAEAELADEAIALRDMMSERDAAEAALTKERERLDWLAESWDNPLAINLHPSYGWSAASKNIRAAIDAAMKEGNA